MSSRVQADGHWRTWTVLEPKELLRSYFDWERGNLPGYLQYRVRLTHPKTSFATLASCVTGVISGFSVLAQARPASGWHARSRDNPNHVLK